MSQSINKGLIIAIVVTSVLLAALFGIYFFEQARKSDKLPVLGQVRAFSLQDATGASFDSKQLRGKVWVANLFCIECSANTDEISKNMASLSRTFDQVPSVQLVSITVKPEQDTAQDLRAYIKKFSTGKNNWHFLTGNKEDIRRLVLEDFKVKTDSDQQLHSVKFPLVDRSGHIRGYYDGSKTADVNRLFSDANVLLKERF